MAAVATARPNWKDAGSGGKQGTPPGPNWKRNLPDYGPLSARVICPIGKYLFSPEDELPPPRVGRGRKMTPGDFQVVSMYTDLSRRDIGYLQSIARIYDVTQMRELIQCRINHMAKKKRCLDVTRHEDYKVYGGYLKKKYGDRMPHLMPLIHDQPRTHKPWPRVTEYPINRNQLPLRNAARKDTRQASLSPPKASAQEESNQRDSNMAVRGSEPGEAKQYRKKGKATEKLEKVEQKSVAEKVVGKSEAASTKRLSKTTPAQRKSVGSKDVEDALGGPSSQEDAKLDPSPVEHGRATRSKKTTKKLSSGKVDVVSQSKEDDREKTVDFVDMFCNPTEDAGVEQDMAEVEDKSKGGKAGDLTKAVTPKKAISAKKVVSGDVVAAENRYADEKFEEPTGSDDNTPEIAKSVSLDDVEGVFSPEYDEATGQSVRVGRGQAEVKGDALDQEEEDVEDKPAENSRPDEPAEEMDEETVKRLEKSPSNVAPLWLFDEDNDERVQVFPAETSSFVELEALDTERTEASSAKDDELSKTRSGATSRETTSRGDGSSRVEEQTDTSETQDLTTSGDEEDDLNWEEVPSCVF